MGSITFRCKSCATLLRARANKAGHEVRCKHCGTIITVPERAVSTGRPSCQDVPKHLPDF